MTRGSNGTHSRLHSPVTAPDLYPLMIDVRELRGHRVFWRIERNDTGSELEDIAILASEEFWAGVRGH